MNVKNLKLITVVAEAFVSDRIIREMKRLGATGYTATAANGGGSRTSRASEGERKNVKIETLVNEQVATRILDLLAAHYLNNYAIVTYIQEVGVARGEEYG
ncbi:MAG: hypothetical protein WD490_01320 [Opitutales bacterium]